MTRWGCKVSLSEGVPCSPPELLGWPERRSVAGCPDIVLYSTAATRYICCHACHEWFPDTCHVHKCPPPTIVETREEYCVGDCDYDYIYSSDSDSKSKCASVSDETSEDRVYVISTDENYETLVCNVCNERMRLEYIQDIEGWVFMDCVERGGVPIHELCRDCAYGGQFSSRSSE